MVTRTEAIVAMAWPAREALLRGSEHDLRAAVILLDSTLETQLLRRVRDLSLFHRVDSRARYGDGVEVAISLNDLGQRVRLQGQDTHWVLSNRSRKALVQEFAPKAQYLAWWGDIPEGYIGPIVRLHQYRNEVLHNDSVRPRTFRLAAALGIWFAAELLRRLSPLVVSLDDDAVDRVRLRVGLPPDPTTVLDRVGTNWLHELHAAIADQLVESLDQEFRDVPNLLREILLDRLVRLDEGLRVIAENESDVLLNGWRELRPARVPSVTDKEKSAWMEQAEEVATAADAVTAFARLAAFETAFEPLETAVNEVADAIRDRNFAAYDDWRHS
jgi:hypothetical protein